MMNNPQKLKEQLTNGLTKPVEAMNGFELQVYRLLLELWETANDLQIDHNAPVDQHEAAAQMSAGVVDLFCEVSQMPRGGGEGALLNDLTQPQNLQSSHYGSSEDRFRFDGAVLELVRTVHRAMANNYLPVKDPPTPELWERLKRRILLLIFDAHDQTTDKERTDRSGAD